MFKTILLGLLFSTTAFSAGPRIVDAQLVRNKVGGVGGISIPNNVTISSSEVGALSGVTSSIQTQLNARVTSVSGASPLASTGGATPVISLPVATSSANGYLSALDWTTFNAKQAAGSYVLTTRSINTTAPLTGGGDLSADRTIAMPAATSSADGYLTSGDWTTFNAKQASGAYITQLNGDVTAVGPGFVSAALSAVGTPGTYVKVTTDSKGRVTSGSAAPLTVPDGGTGLASYNSGAVLITTGPTTISGLPIGSNGQVLTVSGGAIGWFPVQSSGGGSGTVTTVNTGSGLTGGPITTSGTVAVNFAQVASPQSVSNAIAAAPYPISSALAPLVVSGTQISLPQATSSANGYIASSDFAVFSNSRGMLAYFSGPLANPNIVSAQVMNAGVANATMVLKNMIGVAPQFVSCGTNPTIVVYDCGTSAACGSPTTKASVTLSGINTVTVGAVSSPSITAGNFWQIAMTAGVCDTLNFSVTAAFGAQ